MRRRRLFRYNAQFPSGSGFVSEFDMGVRHGLEMARQQQARIVAEARREALAAAQRLPYFALGFAAGSRAPGSGSGGPAPLHGYTYSDLENARRRGFEEGRTAASGMGGAGAIRKKAIDDMLENCRVIAESNPNMTADAFMKAVQHRSKKLSGQ